MFTGFEEEIMDHDLNEVEARSTDDSSRKRVFNDSLLNEIMGTRFDVPKGLGKRIYGVISDTPRHKRQSLNAY